MHSKLTKFLCLQLQFIPDLSRFLSTNCQQTELLKKSSAPSISGWFRHVVCLAWQSKRCVRGHLVGRRYINWGTVPLVMPFHALEEACPPLMDSETDFLPACKRSTRWMFSLWGHSPTMGTQHHDKIGVQDSFHPFITLRRSSYRALSLAIPLTIIFRGPA